MLNGKVPSKNFDDLFLVFCLQILGFFLFFPEVYLPKYTTNFKAKHTPAKKVMND